jgi:ribosomal protein S18 acetylase RimI-like enzyme
VTGLLSLADVSDRDRFLPELVPLVHEAGNPYFDWIFGGASRARKELSRWMQRPSSEVALARTTVLPDGKAVAGAYIALAGDQLRRCRTADAVALIASMRDEERHELRARLHAARGLFAPVDPGDWYLSKLAVHASFRGRGLGRELVSAYREAGENAGFQAFRLDVSHDNAAAIALYLAKGFRIAHDGWSADGSVRYLGMRLVA